MRVYYYVNVVIALFAYVCCPTHIGSPQNWRYHKSRMTVGTLTKSVRCWNSIIYGLTNSFLSYIYISPRKVENLRMDRKAIYKTQFSLRLLLEKIVQRWESYISYSIVDYIPHSMASKETQIIARMSESMSSSCMNALAFPSFLLTMDSCFSVTLLWSALRCPSLCFACNFCLRVHPSQ